MYKEIRTTKMEEVTTVKYVCDDGKEFTSEHDARTHDYAKDKEIAGMNFRSIGGVELGSIDTIDADYDGSNHYYAATLNSMLDVDKLTAFVIANYGRLDGPDGFDIDIKGIYNLYRGIINNKLPCNRNYADKYIDLMLPCKVFFKIECNSDYAYFINAQFLNPHIYDGLTPEEKANAEVKNNWMVITTSNDIKKLSTLHDYFNDGTVTAK